MIAPRKSIGKRKTIPFSFVLENLHPHEPEVRPMFGCHAVYVGGKLVLILRHRENHPEVNGVWLATGREHHASLKKEFPFMHSVTILGNGVTNWQMLHEDSKDFEESVLRACELVVRGDPRIGRIPAKKKRRGERRSAQSNRR